MKTINRIKRILKEDLMKQLFANTGILFSGNLITQALGLLTLSLTTKILGAESFGILIIIQTYILLIDQLLNFQSWQALIKFGTESLEEGNHENFKRFIKISTLIDVVGACFATVVSMIVIQWAGPLLKLSPYHINMVRVYSITILFHLSGTPIAILRMFSKFKMYSTIKVIGAFIKLIGVVITFILGGNLWSMLIVWMITEVIDNVLILLSGHYVLFSNNVFKWWKVRLIGGKEFIKFTIWTNLTAALDVPVKQFDMILVSMVISFEGVAVYKVIKQVAQVITKFTDPIYQVIYPQLVKLVTKSRKEATKFTIKTGIIIIVLLLPIVLILSISSPVWLNVFFGREFATAWKILTVYLLLKVVSVTFVGIHPLFIALGLVKKNIVILAISNILYVILTLVLGNIYGLMGIVLAYGAQFMTVVLLKIYNIRGLYKKHV